MWPCLASAYSLYLLPHYYIKILKTQVRQSLGSKCSTKLGLDHPTTHHHKLLTIKISFLGTPKHVLTMTNYAWVLGLAVALGLGLVLGPDLEKPASVQATLADIFGRQCGHFWVKTMHNI